MRANREREYVSIYVCSYVCICVHMYVTSNYIDLGTRILLGGEAGQSSRNGFTF